LRMRRVAAMRRPLAMGHLRAIIGLACWRSDGINQGGETEDGNEEFKSNLISVFAHILASSGAMISMLVAKKRRRAAQRPPKQSYELRRVFNQA